MATVAFDQENYGESGVRANYTPTPDRRYFVVRGRLWRLSNPWLDPETHERLVRELVSAKRALSDAVAERGALLRALAHAGTQGEIESLHRRLSLATATITRANVAFAQVSRRAANASLEVRSISSGVSVAKPLVEGRSE